MSDSILITHELTRAKMADFEREAAAHVMARHLRDAPVHQRAVGTPNGTTRRRLPGLASYGALRRRWSPR